MKKWILAFVVGGMILTSKVAMATAEFETRYESSYDVDLSGMATATLKVSLTNKLSNVYADRFSLSIGSTDVSNVKVRDAVGLIAPETVRTSNQTTIRFQFIDKVVGKDKVNNFTVSYQTRDIASKNGSVWEVNVPQLETDKGVTEQKVTLSVPSEFGKPAFMIPQPDHEVGGVGRGTKNSYVFGSNTLGKKAISAVFGTTQYMKFNLSYHLDNPNPVRQKAEVALPPDTSYQRMIFESINPKPENVVVDRDGNWIAEFLLEPNELTEVKVVGVAQINFLPRQSQLSETESLAYLAGSQFWPVDDTQIRSLGIQLREPRAIYQYVVDYLSYDYNKLEAGNKRLGAGGALSSPLNAICTEFTDLFVALNRAAGIPARELEGFAFTNNDKLRPLSLTQDVLHAWPEYYDVTKKTWVQVDPTWGKTTGGIDYFSKLDLNHFVFAIHGSDPVEPLPAGAYKTAGSGAKDVRVMASDPVVLPSVDLRFFAKVVRSIKGVELLLTVENQGMVSSQGMIKWNSEPAGIIMGQEEEVIPPFGKRVYVEKLPWNLGIGKLPSYLVVDDGQKQKRIPIEVGSDKSFPLQVAAGVVGACVLAGTAYLAWSLLLRRRDR